jgi:serine protease
MRKLGSLLLVLYFSFGSAAAAFAAQAIGALKLLGSSGSEHVPGEVLVRFHPDTDTTRADHLIMPASLSNLECIHTLKLCRMGITDGSSVEEMASAVRLHPRVAHAEPNYIDRPLGVPGPEVAFDAPLLEVSDPNYSQQWHYRLIHLPEAWNRTTGTSSLVIAQVDTGARFDHPDLGPRLSGNGWDFITNDANPTDPGGHPAAGHGTHVAGTLGAVTNNGRGVAGVTWKNPILQVRTLFDDQTSTHFAFAQGFLYAAGLLKAPDPVNPTPAKIINYSAGGSDSLIKRDAVARVNAAGVIMVVAAGNNGDFNGAIDYPGAYSRDFPMVICVGATNYGNGHPTRAYYSSTGPALNVVAPGGDTSEDSDNDGHVDGVLSTTWKFGSNSATYQFWQGTSMATPHVTGVAALLLGRGCPASRIRPILQNSATDLGPPGFDNRYGYGLIDAEAALNKASRDLSVCSLAGFGATSRRELANDRALFKWRVKNNGCASTAKSSIRFWLSSDYQLGVDDIYLGVKTVPKLTGATATEFMQVSFALKTKVDPNQRWYVIARVNSEGTMSESRKKNNQRVCRLTDL